MPLRPPFEGHPAGRPQPSSSGSGASNNTHPTSSGPRSDLVQRPRAGSSRSKRRPALTIRTNFVASEPPSEIELLTPSTYLKEYIREYTDEEYDEYLEAEAILELLHGTDPTALQTWIRPLNELDFHPGIPHSREDTRWMGEFYMELAEGREPILSQENAEEVIRGAYWRARELVRGDKTAQSTGVLSHA